MIKFNEKADDLQSNLINNKTWCFFIFSFRFFNRVFSRNRNHFFFLIRLHWKYQIRAVLLVCLLLHRLNSVLLLNISGLVIVLLIVGIIGVFIIAVIFVLVISKSLVLQLHLFDFLHDLLHLDLVLIEAVDDGMAKGLGHFHEDVRVEMEILIFAKISATKRDFQSIAVSKIQLPEKRNLLINCILLPNPPCPFTTKNSNP